MIVMIIVVIWISNNRIYVYINIYVYRCVYVYIYIYTYMCIYIRKDSNIDIYIYICIYVCVYLHTYNRNSSNVAEDATDARRRKTRRPCLARDT